MCIRVHANDERVVRERLDWLAGGGLEMPPLEAELARAAGVLRASTTGDVTAKSVWGDCFALALAKQRQAPLATSEPRPRLGRARRASGGARSPQLARKEAVGTGKSTPPRRHFMRLDTKKLTRLVSGLTMSGVSDVDGALWIQFTNGSTFVIERIHAGLAATIIEPDATASADQPSRRPREYSSSFGRLQRRAPPISISASPLSSIRRATNQRRRRRSTSDAFEVLPHVSHTHTRWWAVLLQQLSGNPRPW